MKPTENQIRAAVRTMSTMVFFPVGGEGEVADLLVRMVDSAENLEWLRVTLRDRVSKWPGLAEIRAIYCSSHRPMDGEEGEGYSLTPGFTPADIERENLKPLPESRRVGAGKPLKQIDGSMLDKPIDDDKPN